MSRENAGSGYFRQHVAGVPSRLVDYFAVLTRSLLIARF
jgi:hypothetical protein